MKTHQTQLKADFPRSITAEELFQILKANESSLNYFFDAYVTDEGTSVNHSMALLKLEDITMEGATGLVALKYREDYQLGCSDLSGVVNKELDFKVVFDSTNKQIRVIGPPIPEALSPNEEL